MLPDVWLYSRNVSDSYYYSFPRVTHSISQATEFYVKDTKIIQNKFLLLFDIFNVLLFLLKAPSALMKCVIALMQYQTEPPDVSMNSIDGSSYYFLCIKQHYKCAITTLRFQKGNKQIGFFDFRRHCTIKPVIKNMQRVYESGNTITEKLNTTNKNMGESLYLPIALEKQIVIYMIVICSLGGLQKLFKRTSGHI